MKLTTPVAQWPERIRAAAQPIAEEHGLRVEPRISAVHDAIVVRFMRGDTCVRWLRIESESMYSAVSDDAFDDLVRLESRRCLEQIAKGTT